ncbi:cytochrome C [Candidatus Marinamargulisbacteria bacterium SCGC AG-343-K17]|nr:cytochrome C [Candidatus Marinamargulisbacteria bacterium SCGC AG-343-K17]
MSPQIFPKWANFLPVIALVTIVAILGTVVHLFWYWFSPKHLNVGYQPKQPIPFSHAVHVETVGLDCRYCHSNVDKAAHSNIPATETCMNCHKQIKTESKHIKKLTKYYESGEPIEWVKVHMLPDYAYFNHSAHVNVGVSCVQCHGQVNKMDVVYQAKPLSMGWCLECHREPEKYLWPKEKITDLDWRPKDQVQLGLELKEKYNVNPGEDCSVCHR